ncbi:MAG: hypothetical protein O3A15_02925 [Proteobacteria bacterium]|jgi:hypothetical protein|nr:hypothetical protein [Pseudomonadota bacterium]
MIKHKGFPSRLPGTDFQFTVRRENKNGPTPIISRERYLDRKPSDKRADEGFLEALWSYFGDSTFCRGNLDAGRICWFFGREIVSVEDFFDSKDYDALLRIDQAAARRAFPKIFDRH